MPSVHEELRAAGIELAVPGRRSAWSSECARMARRMAEELVLTVGFVPADDDVAVPAVAIELGRALAEKSARPVGVVDAQGSWPCAEALIARAPPNRAPLATNWLADGLAILTARSHLPGRAVEQLTGLVLAKPGSFGQLVVDLTGLDRLGEHLGAFDLLDAVVLVARRGRTTMRQIQRRLAEIPEGRTASVLLTGL